MASLRHSASAARPTLSSSAAEAVKKGEMKEVKPAQQAQEEVRHPASNDDGAENEGAEEQTPQAAAASRGEEAEGEDHRDLESWQEVDNRRVYDTAAPAPKAAVTYRTLRDDTTFRHTRYQVVPGSDGKMARKRDRLEKRMEKHLREKTRNWWAVCVCVCVCVCQALFLSLSLSLSMCVRVCVYLYMCTYTPTHV